MTFARSRGRPRLNKIPVQVQLSPELVAELKTSKPELLKPGTTNFRHGALSSWMESLLWTELRKPKYAAQVPMPAESRRLDGGNPLQDLVRRGFPGQPLQPGPALGGGDSSAGRSLGGTEESYRDDSSPDAEDFRNIAGDFRNKGEH